MKELRLPSCKKYITCEDCIHYVLCDNTSDLLAPELCDYYKPRSNFIELQDDCRNKLLLDLKNEITKINEGLFWASDDSVREYKCSEILEIKKVLIQAYRAFKDVEDNNFNLFADEKEQVQ